MVVISGKDKVVWWRFFVTLTLILMLQVAQEWLSYAYYNATLDRWESPFDQIFARFMLREFIVYTNVWVGFRQFKQMGVMSFIPRLFLVCSIAFDGLFILMGGLRVLFPDNGYLLSKYGESFGYINSGLLFVFCFGFHFVIKSDQVADS